MPTPSLPSLPRRTVCLLILALAALPGCKVWRVQTATDPETFVQNEDLERIQVVRGDNTRTELWSPVISGDSLRGLPTELAVRPVSIPLSDVRRVATRHFSLTRTLLLVVAVGAGAYVYDLMMSVNQTF